MLGANRCAGCCLAAAILLGTAAVASGEPQLATIDLFTADEGGYASYRIPCLVATRNGTLLAFCEARKTRSDWAAIDLLLRTSSDGGKTWSPPRQVGVVASGHRKNPVAVERKIVKNDEPTYNNPLAIVDRQNTVHLLYCLEYMRVFYTRSSDDGRTFSPPVEITASLEAWRPRYDWRVLAVGPGHGIQLQNGRLLATAWLSTATGPNAHHPSVISTVYSDDLGQSWQCGEIIAPERDPLVDPSEHQAVQLADGQVLINIRSEAKANRRAVATSLDGATGWTAPTFDEQLVEPICMASICRLSDSATSDRNRLLFSNPANLERADGKSAPGKHRDRRNLMIRLSYDEAGTWPVAKTLEAGPSAYSDLAVSSDGTIYCLYERGGPDPREPESPTPHRLALARFNLEWLTDGQDRLPARP